MASCASFYFLIVVFFTNALCSSSSDASSLLGVNYGRIAPDLPSLARSIALIKRLGFGRVKLFDADPLVLSALSGSGLQVVVGVPNADIPRLSRHPVAAHRWVRRSILPHWPFTRIVLVNVGNEIISNRSLRPRLLPAMKNLHRSLAHHNLSRSIKVTTSVSMNALVVSYPASAGRFREDVASLLIKPMLHFLARTNSHLFLNVYPFLSWAFDPQHISLNYALFGVVDDGNCRYSDVLSPQIDAAVAAMETLGYPHIRIAISETGWPSKGDSDQPGAKLQYAAAYNQMLARRLIAKVPSGTTKRPGKRIQAYMFSLFDESGKPGPSTERNGGLLYSHGAHKYELDLRGGNTEEGKLRKFVSPLPVLPTPASNSNHVQPSPSVPSASNSFPPSHSVFHSTPHSSQNMPSFPAKLPSAWCVANSSMDQMFIQEAMLVACSFGGADCTPIEPGKSCFQPNTLQAHASYVFNSYWQRTKHLGGTCTFDGAAMLTHKNPSYVGCTFEYRG